MAIVFPTFPSQCESRRSAVGHYRLPSLSEEEEEGEQGEEEDEKFSLTRVSTNFLKQVREHYIHYC